MFFFLRQKSFYEHPARKQRRYLAWAIALLLSFLFFIVLVICCFVLVWSFTNKIAIMNYWHPNMQNGTGYFEGRVCTDWPSEEQMRLAYTEGQPTDVCRTTEEVDEMAYNNVCFTVTDVATPDPYVTYAHGKYYMTFTAGDRVEIWSSPNLLEIGRACTRTTVWRAPPHTDHSGGVWAPELHALQGRWYIYVAAEDPRYGNKSHRMFVLGGPPATRDPTSGTWEFLGPIAGMPSNQWAIDGTILPLNGKLYFVYSGWPLGQTESDLIQELFIIELETPTKASSRAVSISQPKLPWELTANHGINEGPQVLIHPDGHSWVGIAYSCAGSWTKDYKMNTLQYLPGSDPLDPSSWRKSHTPLITGRMSGGPPFGPGHGSFMTVSGDTVGIFHATDKATDGWENRKARIQRVTWTADGPKMGEVGPLVDDVRQYLAPGGGAALGIPGGRVEKRHWIEELLDKGLGFLKKF